ncbi:hypothetical protein BME96_14985 [Virgibacillus halodenitrificans]|jgi:hypothetical protein|uniref:Diguanylate cyclase n=1 Tax=Virgibacillus halodenitrificans TaxID=1482 RepID=A0AAC9NLW9_VIRHA|nr:hypothetical protein [Virgibacillus halodenitrificans]APC49418.1 hypothetical protein BME96_14985 [Virgibacillus halodenitrificans]MCJ0929948.1 hypothetical protein [Virgibacillus halodenitrificans]
MDRLNKLSIAALVWIGTFLLLFYFIQTFISPFYFALIAIIPFVVFLNLKDKLAFLLFISFILISSFGLLIYAFQQAWETPVQLAAVGIHAIIVAHIGTAYVLTKWIKALAIENRQLQKRVNELAEYIANTRVLSFREFNKQKELITNAMVRRKETGYLLTLRMNKWARRVKKSGIDLLAESVYTSVREHFDVVGKQDKDTILILLQNTGEDGLHIVKERISNRLEDVFTPEIINKIEWDKEIIGYERQEVVKEGDAQ